jgi:hypothetical protein
MKENTSSENSELTFEDFKKRARDNTLTRHEKVGFPTAYREEKEGLIFADITRKLPSLEREDQTVLEIGPGCSGPASLMIQWCREHRQKLLLIDCEEMLEQLPNEPFIEKFAGHYPDQCGPVFERYAGKVGVIVCYSVLHYLFLETNLFDFLDQSLTLLADGGEMLVGDIPNVSKRKRFFASSNGRRFHQQFTGTDEVPVVNFKSVERGKIDDSVLVALLLRARAAGFDAYLLPQPGDLPMANRREDLLIKKP